MTARPSDKYKKELEELARIIESWDPDHPAWERIAQKLTEPDPISDILKRACRRALTYRSGKMVFDL